MKASKCSFSDDRVTCLGHTVFSKGIHTNSFKIKAAQDLQPPKDLEQLRAFLCLAGYYLKFIPDFATIATPLTELAKESAKFSSRTLSGRERNCTATEKEALAIVFAVQHFCVYLLCHDFCIVTDNSALRWLHSVGPKERIARWIMTIQEYKFTFKHRPGSFNQNADALSY